MVAHKKLDLLILDRTTFVNVLGPLQDIMDKEKSAEVRVAFAGTLFVWQSMRKRLGVVAGCSASLKRRQRTRRPPSGAPPYVCTLFVRMDPMAHAFLKRPVPVLCNHAHRSSTSVWPSSSHRAVPSCAAPLQTCSSSELCIRACACCLVGGTICSQDPEACKRAVGVVEGHSYTPMLCKASVVVKGFGL